MHFSSVLFWSQYCFQFISTSNFNIFFYIIQEGRDFHLSLTCRRAMAEMLTAGEINAVEWGKHLFSPFLESAGWTVLGETGGVPQCWMTKIAIHYKDFPSLPVLLVPIIVSVNVSYFFHTVMCKHSLTPAWFLMCDAETQLRLFFMSD